MTHIRSFPKFSYSIKLIELIWKMTIGSLELSFVLPILYLLYIVVKNKKRNYT